MRSSHTPSPTVLVSPALPAASWMISEGVPLMDVKEVLGHSTVKMTEKYAHLAPHTRCSKPTRQAHNRQHLGRSGSRFPDTIWTH
ncbi:tyrosine-type recombinase/integrase [Vreelandella aquamarina]|uniref:tyrosine-type recombinase/integrase n=1 Tax=Vreelandella aquamarina TaxID=77097 RepID=UPI00384FF21A